jgi:hypothetical protein
MHRKAASAKSSLMPVLALLHHSHDNSEIFLRTCRGTKLKLRGGGPPSCGPNKYAQATRLKSAHGAMALIPSENRTEGDRIGTKQSGPFEAVPSASLIWTIYYRILKHIEARRRVCNYKEPIITISNSFIGFKMMIFKLKI